jgi:hypothetical protein
LIDERHDPLVPDPLLRRAARGLGSDPPSNACLSAETAAAWADGALPPDEVSSLMGHAAECARCRSLLAALVQTEPLVAADVPWWKAPVVQWGAPLAAVAGGLMIWVAVQQPPPQPSAVPPPSASASAAADQTARTARPSEERPQSSKNPSLADATSPQAAVAPPQAKVDAPRRQAASRPAAARDTPPASPPPAAAAEPITSAAAPVQMQSQARNPVAPAGARTEMRADEKAVMLAEIVSPDPSSRWRLGQPGTIERSIDGGRTWSRQSTGVDVILTAGSSPAPATCWIVGAGGTVLRTTDGHSWERLAAPDSADLVGVAARDAATATVTTVDGRTFHTDDGGATWTRRPVQEDPAASF